MQKQEKINEARYFLGGMREVLDQPEHFRYELSAFMSAARSVFQYIHKEVKTDPPKLAWYESQVSSNPVIQFLRNARNTSIHARPVRPKQVVHAVVTDRMTASAGAWLTRVDADGTVSHGPAPYIEPTPPVVEQAPHVSHAYYFDGWAGKEDVLSLCATYVKEIVAFVNDGVTNGHLTDTVC